jgi:hypothetical protein
MEAVMARLMPPAISENCQHELEALIDDLAGPEPAAEISRVNWTLRAVMGGGIAAAVGALCAIFPFQSFPDSPVAVSVSESPGSGLVLISESDRVESMTDEGWSEDVYGSAMHAVRLNVIEENQMRDEESGMLVKISEPREEMLLMPISSF